MDPNDYRRIVSQPDAFRRSELDDSVRVLRRTQSHYADVLGEIVEGPPIEKPPLHAVGAEADHFGLDLDLEDVDTILDDLVDARAAALRADPDRVTSPDAHRLAQLVDAWTAYRDWLDDGRAA